VAGISSAGGKKKWEAVMIEGTASFINFQQNKKKQTKKRKKAGGERMHSIFEQLSSLVVGDRKTMAFGSFAENVVRKSEADRSKKKKRSEKRNRGEERTCQR